MLGSFTRTCWKRRSSAESFSICFLYSSRVVAPITCSSPLARSGLSMLAASIAPSAFPAPIMVWSSSMKRITSPAFVASSSPFLKRSSNSPLNLVPATIDARSRDMTLFPARRSGTSLLTILAASPSAIAVLPTPGSPMRTGLFFVLLTRICMTREISSSRPITGSIRPSFASAVRSLQYLSRTFVLLPSLPLPLAPRFPVCLLRRVEDSPPKNLATGSSSSPSSSFSSSSRSSSSTSSSSSKSAFSSRALSRRISIRSSAASFASKS